jgi:hypothetical protein
LHGIDLCPAGRSDTVFGFKVDFTGCIHYFRRIRLEKFMFYQGLTFIFDLHHHPRQRANDSPGATAPLSPIRHGHNKKEQRPYGPDAVLLR